MEPFIKKFLEALEGCRRSTWISFIMLILFVLVGQSVGQFIGTIIAYMILQVNSSELQNILTNPTHKPEAKTVVLLYAGFISLCSYVVAPLIYISSWKKTTVSALLDFKPNPPIIYVLPIFIIMAFMPLNLFLFEWNSQIVLPDFMSGFEVVARTLEERAQSFLVSLTNFENNAQLFVGVLAIAIIPAVGEELLFRGLIQNQIFRDTRNMHLAILISAFLFGAIHLQFYGVVPRILMGILFGYIYYWSGNLIIPILVHFFYNALTLKLIYLVLQGNITDISLHQSFSKIIYIFSFFAGLLLTYLFYRGTKNKSGNDSIHNKTYLRNVNKFQSK